MPSPTCLPYDQAASRQAYKGFSVLQLEAEGDSIVAADISSSGEYILFGSAAGYVHAWALNQTPCVNQVCQMRPQMHTCLLQVSALTQPL